MSDASAARLLRPQNIAAEAILPRVIRQNIELFYVDEDPDFDQVGNIAALLRFRPEKNNSNVRSITDHAANHRVGGKAGLVGRYRGLARG